MNGLYLNGQDSVSQPLLMDYDLLNMAYCYWQQKIHEEKARFEVFFKKNPFKGEFTVFAGLEDCLRFVKNFRFSESDLAYIQQQMADDVEPAFFDYLKQLKCEAVTLQAIPEGSVVFPRVPLIIVEGPLAVCHFLETALLNLVGFASLVTTNAARLRLAAGNEIELHESGLRRAQGPNGGLSASKYSFMGGFDSTSNLLAGQLFHIPVKGTMAHSFVTSFKAGQLERRMLLRADGSQEVNLKRLAEAKLRELFEVFEWDSSMENVNKGELNSFCAYAVGHPHALLALVDTYDTLGSGLPNFCAVALALNELGYRALGCRIDSGDTAYLSREIRECFELLAMRYELDWFANMKIVASNDVDEKTIRSLNNQGHSCDEFGVGTRLVTCQAQPSLGCVFKLVDLEGEPKIKLSEDIGKMNIPCAKKAYRLFSKNGTPRVDLLTQLDEPAPRPGQRVHCRHPFDKNKWTWIVPHRVENLHLNYWHHGRIQLELPGLPQIREHAKQSIASLRWRHVRPLDPEEYKVSLSTRLFDEFNRIWLNLEEGEEEGGEEEGGDEEGEEKEEESSSSQEEESGANSAVVEGRQLEILAMAEQVRNASRQALGDANEAIFGASSSSQQIAALLANVQELEQRLKSTQKLAQEQSVETTRTHNEAALMLSSVESVRLPNILPSVFHADSESVRNEGQQKTWNDAKDSHDVLTDFQEKVEPSRTEAMEELEKAKLIGISEQTTTKSTQNEDLLAALNTDIDTLAATTKDFENQADSDTERSNDVAKKATFAESTSKALQEKLTESEKKRQTDSLSKELENLSEIRETSQTRLYMIKDEVRWL